MTRLVLAGGGHAHLFVLRDLALRRDAGLDVVLVNPGPWTIYSGMIPGWMAGKYRPEFCRIDLKALAVSAGVRMEIESVAGIDPGRREVRLSGGRVIAYDLLSIDVGSETDTGTLGDLGSRLVPVKPLVDFIAAWSAIVDASILRGSCRLVVVGGGAAGVEIALAARAGLLRVVPEAEVTLVSGSDGLLPTHAVGVRRRAVRSLERQGVRLLKGSATAGAEGVRLDGGLLLEADHVIAATGARSPSWLGSTGLALDARGYIAVDASHRSLSHGNVFAAGDVCSRENSHLARSGVHAVHVGPVLAYNLHAAAESRPLRPFHPRRHSLYLMSTGDGRAIASWGRFGAEGALIFRLKDFIDRRFVRSFTSDGMVGQD